MRKFLSIFALAVCSVYGQVVTQLYTGGSSAGSGNIVSSSVSVTAGLPLVVQGSIDNSATITGVTCSIEGSLTQISIISTGLQSRLIYTYWVSSATGGSETCTLHLSGSWSIGYVQINTLPSGYLYDKCGGTSGSGANIAPATTGTGTTCGTGNGLLNVSNELLLSMFCGNVVPSAQPSGYTVLTALSNSYEASAYGVGGTAGSAVTATWTNTAADAGATIVAFYQPVTVTFKGVTLDGTVNRQLIQGLNGGGISLTAQTAAIGTATLCDTNSCSAGQYRIVVYIASTVVCATPGPAVVGVTLTYTDDAGTKTAVTLPLEDSGALTTPATTLALGTTTGFGFGHMTVWSSGANPIQYATTYTACTTGTGTYSLRIGVERLQ